MLLMKRRYNAGKRYLRYVYDNKLRIIQFLSGVD